MATPTSTLEMISDQQ